MKALRQLLISALALGGLCCGCDHNETPLFDTSYSALNIWFGTASTVTDSTTYNYSYALEKDSLMFRARVSGLLADHDRTFTLEAYDGTLDEAEGSFQTTTYTLKAGESEAEFPIYFDTSKLKDPDSFTTTDGYLYFRMSDNDTFLPGAYNMTVLKVVLKNYLDKPAEWDVATYPMRPYANYFGTYSKVKYQFMIQELGLVDFHISYTATTSYDAETNTISSTYASYLVERMEKALETYNATHDTPLTDESGSLVTF